MVNEMLFKLFKSRRFWGMLVSVTFKLLAAKGYIGAAGQEQVDLTVENLFVVASGIGDLIATYGMLKAEKPGMLSEAAKAKKETGDA